MRNLLLQSQKVPRISPIWEIEGIATGLFCNITNCSNVEVAAGRSCKEEIGTNASFHHVGLQFAELWMLGLQHISVVFVVVTWCLALVSSEKFARAVRWQTTKT